MTTFCTQYLSLLDQIENTGECLEKAMLFAGVDRSSLCSHLKMHKVTLSKVMNNEQFLDLSKINEICKFLGNTLLRDYVTYQLNKPQ